MSYKLYSDEEKRLQKKLIPLNIVVALLALIAAVSLIIFPLMKINLGKAMSALGNLVGGTSEVTQVRKLSEEGENGEAGDGSAENEGGAESNGGGNSQDLLFAMFEDIDAEIVLAPLDMFKVLTAPENEKGAILIDKFLIETGLVEKLALSLTNFTLAVATQAITSESDLEKLDIDALNDALLKIDKAQSQEDVEKELNDYLGLLEGQLDIKFTDEEKGAARDNTLNLYNKTVEATDGSFSLEKMVCVNMSPEDGKTYTSYSDLTVGILNGDVSFSGNSSSELSGITDMLNKMAAPYGYMFIYVAFNALIWFILFLFAFFRMFAKNKRFTMWYVKLIGCWPCIIFFLVPFAMSKVAASVAVLAPFAGLFAAITSMTWISGICYLLLWLFSICWAFPIKHKIRKLRKGKA